MSYAHEFEKWAELLDGARDEDTRQLIWEAMQGCSSRSQIEPEDIADAAREIAPALCWVAFWPSLAAVICTEIWRAA